MRPEDISHFTFQDMSKLLIGNWDTNKLYWSRRCGEFVNPLTGEVVSSSLRFPGSILEWFCTLPVAIQKVSKTADIYVSPDVLVILEHLPSFKPDFTPVEATRDNMMHYRHAGSIFEQDIWVNEFHHTERIVLLDPNFKLVGQVSVVGMNSIDAPAGWASTGHDPQEAIRIAAKEPIAKTDYKTDDSNWFNPNSTPLDRTLRIKFKKLTETATLPKASREGDIGFDLCCDEDFEIGGICSKTVKVSTGIQLADMPSMDNDRNRIFMKIEGRSGLSVKGIFPTGGVIDPTYRGEVAVVLNSTGRYVQFKKGERIAQLVIYKVATAGEVVMEEAEKITETNRGAAGFGSSGK
jgi:deoxyuridine 5'-triphosphate nucleotidohydrolase